MAKFWSIQTDVSRLGVLLPDLPALAAQDIESIIFALEEKPIVLCPDREDFGTNALAMRPAGVLDFLFEGASFSRHLQAAGVDSPAVRTGGAGFSGSDRATNRGDGIPSNRNHLFPPDSCHGTGCSMASLVRGYGARA